MAGPKQLDLIGPAAPKKERPFRLTAPPKVRESAVAAACCDLLKYRGYKPVRIPTGLYKTPDGRWISVGEVGLPDYVVLHERYPGFFLEVKRPGGKLEPHQISKRQELQVGYHLAVAAVDDVAALASWLAIHESTHLRNERLMPL